MTGVQTCALPIYIGFRGSVFIVDDNFFGNRGRVKELLRGIADWQEDHDHPFKLSTEASIDLADDPELLELMATSGFAMVFVGLETPVQESLTAAGKRQNLKGDMVAKVHRIQEAGIEVTAGFIIGFDSDPPDIARRQIDFIQELGVPTAMVGLLMALPNTKLWDRLTREGRMLFRSKGNNTHTVELNFVPKLPAELLTNAYHTVLKSIYTPRNYFDRCLGLLKRFPRTASDRRSKEAAPITGPQVRALILSVVRQGLSHYALWYWLFVFRAILRRPRLFVTIVTLAVRGHHFFVITDELLGAGHPREARSATPARDIAPAALPLSSSHEPVTATNRGTLIVES